MDAAAVLAEYDRTVRAARGTAGWGFADVGGTVRTWSAGRAIVEYSALGDADVDAAIADTQAWAHTERLSLEWKHYAHDRPANLPDRLRAAGFVAEPTETLVIGAAEDVAARSAGGPPLVGIRLREAGAAEPWTAPGRPAAGVPPGAPLGGTSGAPSGGTARAPGGTGPGDGTGGGPRFEADVRAIAAMHDAVWGGRSGWLAGMLAGEKSADPGALTILLAEEEATGRVVSAAWLRREGDTAFAGLWGGSTLREYRRRGIYSALVAARAALAGREGYRWLTVDASDDSRPILVRLGLVPVTTTTPWVWVPESRRPTGP